MNLAGVNQSEAVGKRQRLLIPGRPGSSGKEYEMLETIIVLLVILWLVGFLGGGRAGIPRIGKCLHVLLIIASVLLVVRLIL